MVGGGFGPVSYFIFSLNFEKEKLLNILIESAMIF